MKNSEKTQTFPENRETRIKLLSEAKKKLKTEFVGLDDIIDNIIGCVSAWYITPEVVKRPVVISLWGMTGTGKTSIIRRLVELLQCKNNTVQFDCGRCLSKKESDIATRVSNNFGINNSEGSIKKLDKAILVFDEFQYARTINEYGLEEISPETRQIWSAIDDGILYLLENYNWSFEKFCEFFLDLSNFSEQHPDITVIENRVVKEEDINELVKTLGFYYFAERLNSYPETRGDEGRVDPKTPIELLSTDSIRVILRRIPENSESKKMLKDLLEGTYSLKDFVEILGEIKKAMIIEKALDCSNSLVFTIGNLDEAYEVGSELSPDIDADVFYNLTKKVSVSDIKNALKKRYRPEQVARLGNNLIKYPTLSRSSFEKIISLEIDRAITDFRKVLPDFEVRVSEGIRRMLYSEGVFPTQGVRPLFTTVNALLMPYFSEIIVNRTDLDTSVTIELGDEGASLNQSVTEVQLVFNTGNAKTYTQKLQLGELREPETRKIRYCCAVHEAGHAVTFAARTGSWPKVITAVATDKGGFCDIYDEDKFEIDSRRDIDNDVIIGLGGYIAESTIFDDREDLLLMGSNKDLLDTWKNYSTNAMRCGYFGPKVFTELLVEVSQKGLHKGFSLDSTVEYFNGKKFTGMTMKLREALEMRYSALQEECTKIIVQEIKLIKEVGKYLGEHGTMNGDKFLEFIDKFGNKLSREYMTSVKSDNSADYFRSKLD